LEGKSTSCQFFQERVGVSAHRFQLVTSAPSRPDQVSYYYTLFVAELLLELAAGRFTFFREELRDPIPQLSQQRGTHETLEDDNTVLSQLLLGCRRAHLQYP
jgi:hypothetical protein